MPPRLLRLGAATVAVAGFLALSPPATAEYLTLNFQGPTTDPGNPTVSFTLNGKSYSNFSVGPFYWKQHSVPPNSNFPPPIATFCIEIDTSQPLPPVGTNTVFSVVKPADAPTIGNDSAKITAITELYGRYYDTAWNDKTKFHGSVESVAFQLALWELLYDGASSKNLSTGNFRAPNLGDNTTTAQSMLDSLNGDTSRFNTRFAGYQLVALLAPAAGGKEQNMVQDQLILSPIPAPPGLMLAGIGMLALLGRARRRRPPAGT
jgi:hypothetical protein